MMRSLYTATTGMLGQQLQIDTTSNNIANVNTVGFKRQRAEFNDLFYQTLQFAGTQTSETTLTPTGIEVGVGVRTGAINRIYSQGSPKESLSVVTKCNTHSAICTDIYALCFWWHGDLWLD